MEYAELFLFLGCLFALLMAWGVGANDVANAMGTSVGSGALTIRQAIVIAAIFEFSGALLAGGEVTDTIRQGIIHTHFMSDHPQLIVYGMLAALCAAASWLGVATFFGWPVSTSHTIVGSVVGFAIIAFGWESVQWAGMAQITLSWIISPLLGGTIAYVLFLSVQKLILETQTPIQRARHIVPVYIFLVGWMVSAMTLISGLKHLGVELPFSRSLFYSSLIGLFISAVGFFLMQRIHNNRLKGALDFEAVEKIFGILMLFTACAMAFAHGSNDVANAIGPLAAISTIVKNGEVVSQTSIPLWVLVLGSVGIIAGFMTYGHKVIATVGSGITELTPSRGFAATLGAASTVVLASSAGLPISTTHTLVGAVLGVGLARGINALNLTVIRQILLSWIITLPSGALFAILFFMLFRSIFS